MAFDTTQESYKDLRGIVAEQSDSVVAWVGAGLSRPAGLPTWEQLRAALTDELFADVRREPDSPSKEDRLAQCKAIEQRPDYWGAFSQIAELMGLETYRAAVRRQFANADRSQVPEAYRHLWRLGISGMINLNVDRFAKRAFTEVNENELVNDFSGRDISDYIHLLRTSRPWLANLHGEIDSASSWVFRQGELNALFANPGYDQLIKTCFASRTVVFLGISADDIAAGEHLRKLTAHGVDCGGHFWITHLTSKRAWAESAGIRLIQYSPDNNHRELLELLIDLCGATSEDTPPVPVAARAASMQLAELPPPDELVTKPAADIRDVLNSHASQVLAETTEDTVAEFERFATEYSEAIYRAWYVDVTPPKNHLLNYRLTELHKEGAFGTVYRATDDTGKQYAIKILHEKVRKSREMLQSFRRGVASMRILTDNSVPGVVHYYNASEIPAMVVMDFIEGIDLLEATRKNVLQEWSDLIRICRQLTEIIRTSHRLPQRVLHRDIRPSNVMIENCWGPNPRWEDTSLWVLDFDLSHHMDAFDVSISSPGQANGFLAPEQVERSGGRSTRNATVDSFGLGMTFYFLRSGVEPRFAQHRYADWRNTLEGLAHNNPCGTWQSLPNRFSRLIHAATREEQENRLEVANIEDELKWLEQAIRAPQSIALVELFTEELAARSMGEYEWDGDMASAYKKLGNIDMRLRGDEKNKKIKLEYGWLQGGGYHHQDVRKWLPTAQAKVDSVLRRAGWDTFTQINTGQLRGSAEIALNNVQNSVEAQALAVSTAKDALSFK